SPERCAASAPPPARPMRRSGRRSEPQPVPSSSQDRHLETMLCARDGGLWCAPLPAFVTDLRCYVVAPASCGGCRASRCGRSAGKIGREGTKVQMEVRLGGERG